MIPQQQPHQSPISLSHKKDQLSSILSMYTSSSFLTRYSLYNHLFSSEPYTLSSQDKQFMRLYFGKESVEEGELYEFTYFHKRDKKMLVYFYVMGFLKGSAKTELIVFENGDKINSMEIREFLARAEYGGSEELVKQFEERVIFFRAETHQMYKLNLHYLPFYCQQRQFLKAIILSDVNQFESGDKSSLQRLYKKIPKNLFVLSLKKQIYDYKFIQKSTLPFVLDTEQITDHYELHEKVTRNINKNIEGFLRSYHGYIVPIEHIGIMSKNLEESFRSVVIRKDGDGQLSQYIFTAWPFQIKAYRKIE